MKKCPYCDFNSHALTGKESFVGYVNALIDDAKSQHEFVQGRSISSIFLGGGTPSLLPIDELARLFGELRETFIFTQDCEVTLEANPGTLEHAPFEEYLKIGVNRLSVGVQSFDDKALQVLGRIHQADNALMALKSAKLAGFDRLNCDLMHGLPHQTPKLAINDINQAVLAGATHISWYQLTIEPNTAFFRRPPHLPDEDVLDGIESLGRECLVAHGFDNYEVSAWVGSEDKACRHNLNYWQFGDYLAIGAGGHGKVTLCGHHDYADGIYRFSKSRMPKDYANYKNYPKFINFQKILDDELIGEYMMNALRLKQGVTVSAFECMTGRAFGEISDKIKKLQSQGLLILDDGVIRPSEKGFRYVNYLVQAFLG